MGCRNEEGEKGNFTMHAVKAEKRSLPPDPICYCFRELINHNEPLQRDWLESKKWWWGHKENIDWCKGSVGVLSENDHGENLSLPVNDVVDGKRSRQLYSKAA